MRYLILLLPVLLLACGDDNPCPDGGSLTGIEGDEQWCSVRDADGNPMKHGPYWRWDKSTGTVEQRGQYCHGLRCGMWTNYYASGAKQSEREYDSAGEICGMLFTWDEEGNITSEEDHGECDTESV